MPHTLDTIKFTDRPEELRGKWKEIKSRYTEVLNAKNIEFRGDLGPMLDKRAAQWKKIHAWQDRHLPDLALVKAIGKAKIVSELNTLVTTAASINTTATNYKNAIHNHLGNPAERALTEALDELIDDAQADTTIGNNLLRALGH